MCKPLLLAISTLFMISSTLQIIKLKFELETEEDRKIITFTKQFDDKNPVFDSREFSKNSEFTYDESVFVCFKSFKSDSKKVTFTGEVSEDKIISLHQQDLSDSLPFVVYCEDGYGFFGQVVKNYDAYNNEKLIM